MTDAGYSVTQEEFTYSSRSARFTPPAAGIFFALVAFLAAHLAISHRSYSLTLAVILVAVFIGVLEMRRFARAPRTGEGAQRSTNVVAVRGTPRVWLIAHIDSKSQTVPMLARVAGVTGVAVGFVGLIALCVAGLLMNQISGDGGSSLITPIEIFAGLVIVSSVPLALCWIGNQSPGALDNASGVAAVLLAAETTQGTGVGVSITSAEELGLAGARAFAAGRSRSIAFNCDTIDDGGEFLAMRSQASNSRQSLTAITTAARRIGIRVIARGMIPGIVTDGTALASAGWDVVTLSRGNLSTLRRVHTSRDTAERITGTGIALAARLLSTSIEELR